MTVDARLLRMFTHLLIGALLLLSQTNAQASERFSWNPPDHTVDVARPSCEGVDALKINTVEQLRFLSDSRYRVFCIEPGDYRSAGVQEIESVSGSSSSPRVIRLLGNSLVEPSAFAQAPLQLTPRLPPLYFRDSRHWVLDRLAFIDIDQKESTFPLRFFASSDIVLNSLRVQGNRLGIEFHHLSHDIVLQNSLIGDMDMDPVKGNDAVCVAFEGRYTDKGQDVEPVAIHDIKVVANEIYNCNDGVQLIWNEDAEHWPDFAGTLIAANDIYIDERRLTDCKGKLEPKGACACTENAVDIKAGSKSAAQPVVIRHNRFYGWRKTDSICNKQAQSWGTAISVHFVAAQNLRIEQNLFWNVVSGVSITKKTRDVEVLDNLFHTVPKAGPGNGVAIISYDTVSGVNISRNKVVQAHGWLSLLSTDTNLSCNVVNQSGPAIGVLSADSFAADNSYYQHTTPRFSSTGDVEVSLATQSADQTLCTELRPLTGKTPVCLTAAISTSQSPHACGGGYWSQH